MDIRFIDFAIFVTLAGAATTAWLCFVELVAVRRKIDALYKLADRVWGKGGSL